VVSLTGLVDIEADVERIAVLAETGVHGVVVVRRHHAHLRVDGAFGHLAGQRLVGIDHAHGQTQLERVGELAPLLQTAAVESVGIGDDRLRAVGREHGDRLVQIGEHRTVDGLLRIERNRLDIGAQRRIGNGTVDIGDAAQAHHLDHLRHSDRILVGGDVEQLEIVSDDPLVDRLVEDLRPVRRRQVGSERIGVEVGVGIGEIAAIDAREQDVGELTLVHVGGYDPALHRREERTHGIAVAIHLVARHLVGVAVDIFVIGRTSGGGEDRRRKEGFQCFIEFHCVWSF